MNDRVVRHDLNGLCTLTLNRPEKLNALDVQTFQAVDAHVRNLEQQAEQVGCVVLRGEGWAFCAGMDLGVVGQEGDPHDFKLGLIDRLACLPDRKSTRLNSSP